MAVYREALRTILSTGRSVLLLSQTARYPNKPLVHALGHGAYGQFESYGDWSNITSACWLQDGAVSEVFTRFSVVVSSTGGSESGRDTHGFATKIYSECGNQDFVGNVSPLSCCVNNARSHSSTCLHSSSTMEQTSREPVKPVCLSPANHLSDLIHSVKFEVDKGFPTGGSAHTTAYDFFTQHPEGSFQLMNVLSDLGIPRDVRHMSGNGVHTYKFINAQGNSQLFKWYWIPKLGHRSLVYDEVTKLQGKNNNFQRVDLYNNIDAGIFPEWEFAVQLFPDDGSYMYKGYDLLIPTVIVPFEINPPVTLGKLTLNRNPSNFFAEPESISFAPSNVVDGVSFVPDPLLQWRLMSYDDTSTHRHNSPNGYLLPINRPISAINNNFRDGYMQPLIFQGASISTPNGIGGVQEPDANGTLTYTSSAGEQAGSGPIGRYAATYDWFGQARKFWGTLDVFAQQHTVDAYRFELGNVANTSVAQVYIDNILNPIDNCLARRVAFGIGAQMPENGPRTNITNATAPYPSLYPLTVQMEPNKSNAGLVVAVIANDTLFSASDMNAMMPMLAAQQVSLTVVGPRIGMLESGVNATASYITASSVFYDAVFVGSVQSGTNSTRLLTLDANGKSFIMEAYSHGKAVGALGSTGQAFLQGLGLGSDDTTGLYAGDPGDVTMSVLDALSGPVRFPWRFPTDDLSAIC